MARALVILIFAAAQIATAQRLPKLALPENYQLKFTPNFTKDNFAGEEIIRIQVLKPTAQIVLNSAEIEFHETSIASAGVTQKAKVTLDKERQMATLDVDKPIAAGPATIQIRYTGILNSQLHGMYLSKIGTRKYAVTQFESTDARRAFPSFDEPAYKATFDLTVIARKSDQGISNGKTISDTPGPGLAQHTIRFATTPKMSSYLVALAVGEFEYIEGSSDGIPIRIWTTPGKKELGRFALQAAEKFMDYYNHYFEIKYPFEKLDILAFPDFAAGAMENTAAITYRESDLLIDDVNASGDSHQKVASVLAHEMAHQWFGDLVTMEWWDDVWLNEGFANWMQTKPMVAWKSDWNIELDDVIAAYGALNSDSVANTRPIHQTAETPEEIEELFDGIAYEKAAAVLHMLEAYLGPEDFRNGVNLYLKQHAYGNATAEDFWQALAKASKKPVAEVMAAFIKQAGAPMVTVETKCAGNSMDVTLSQHRYYYDRKLFNALGDELWKVPVCLKTPLDSSARPSDKKCELLTRQKETFAIAGCAPWVLVNAGANGYYRSSYNSEMIRAVSHDSMRSLTPAERIHLLGDIWASVRVGRNTIGDYLTLADTMQSERNRPVIDQLGLQLDYIGDYLTTNADHESYRQWVRQLLTPAAKSLGSRAAAGDSDETQNLRAHILYYLGYVGRDPDVLAEAAKFTQQALEHPESTDATLASVMFPLAAINGDASFYDKVKAQLKETLPTNQYYLYQETLSEFTDPALLKRTLDYAVGSEVRNQDAIFIIAAVMRNPDGRDLAWDFIKKHWSQVEKTFASSVGPQLVRATGSLCDASSHDEVKDFFATHKVSSSERSLKKALENIYNCADLKVHQSELLASWLVQRNISADKQAAIAENVRRQVKRD